MPALADVILQTSGLEGVAPMTYRAKASVNNEGRFALTVHEDLVEAAKTVAAKTDRCCWKDQNGFEVWLDQGPKNLRAISISLDAAKSFLLHIMKEHLSYPIERDVVILYSHASEVAYTEHVPSGRIHPNGYFAEKDDNPEGLDRSELWRWRGSLHATKTANHYSVGLFAQVMVRERHMKPTGTEEKFINLHQWGYRGMGLRSEGDVFEAEHPIVTRLNGFCGLSLGAGGRGFRSAPQHKVMPYSDEAAEFFVNSMTGMCELARRFEEFFGDVERVNKAIESRLLPLSITSEMRAK